MVARAADAGDEAARERQCQQNADRHAEQRDREFGGPEAEAALDVGNARQPGAEGDRLQEKYNMTRR